MPFSPQEITDKEFLVAMRGYERAEVEAFLRAVAADVAQLRAEVEAANARADAATKDSNGADDSFGRLGESIAMMLRQAKEATTSSLEAAQAEAEQTKTEARDRAEEWLRVARERAELVVSTAQADAERRTGQAVESSEAMLAEARARAAALVTDAEAQADQTLSSARAETIRLEAACEDLRQRLTLAHSILGDLIGHMPEGSPPAQPAAETAETSETSETAETAETSETADTADTAEAETVVAGQGQTDPEGGADAPDGDQAVFDISDVEETREDDTVMLEVSEIHAYEG